MAAQKTLNSEQIQAIQHGEGPLLIIAGAGTGKTTVVTERIKYLILEKGVFPNEILALTFTEKAAREMEERVDVAMPYGYTQMWISTFHAFCDRILRSEAIHIGLNPNYKLATEAESVLFLRKNLFKFDLSYFRPLGNPNKFLEGMLQHFSRLQDEDVNPSQYMEYAKEMSNDKNPHFAQTWPRLRPASKASRGEQNSKIEEELEIKKNLELANAYKTYEDLKVKEGIMDFSDLIANTLKLFRMRPNVLKNYQEQFKYILVDEFQDTNYAQNELAVLLAGEKKNITVVGDDDQAIYRWRGAAISNMISFRQRFPEMTVVTLTKNYRSTKEILDKSYTLIQNNNPDRLEVKENIDKKLTSMRGKKGDPVELLYEKRVEDEADRVAEKIEDLTKRYSLNARRYNDVAILVRANDHAQPFVRALERKGIPYQFLGPGRLFHQEEIKDLIAYIKVLYDFTDSQSLYRVLTMPVFSIPATDIAALLNMARRKNDTLYETLEKIVKENQQESFFPDKTLLAYRLIYEMIGRHMERVSKDTAGQILYYFLEDSKILEELSQSKTQKDEKRSQNIARFFEKLKTYEVEHISSSVYDIVDWIDLSMQMGESPLATDIDWADNNAVNILTVHSSKGLEFKTVFLTNLVTQRFPTRERHEQIPIPQELIKEILPEGDFHMQEERRLFYVGMTRARDQLFLTAAIYYGEGKRERKLSPFVYEALGKETVDTLIQKKKAEKLAVQTSLLDWAYQESSQSSTPIQSGSIVNHQSSINKLTYVSYSQLQCFDFCPLHYKMRYILRVPTPMSSAQSFGTSVHATLRDFYQMTKNGEKVTTDDITNLLQQAWINEGYTSKLHEQSALKKAALILKQYVEANPDAKPEALELPFQFFLGGIKVGGRIDRIDRLKDGSIEIIDYKTGTNIPDEKKLAKDLQLTFYALAATEVRAPVFNKTPEETLLSLYYLEEEKKLTTTRTKEQLEAAKLEILEKVKAIEASDFSCSGTAFCANCEYKMLCKTS